MGLSRPRRMTVFERRDGAIASTRCRRAALARSSSAWPRVLSLLMFLQHRSILCATVVGRR
jgi:hypothetical protein